MRRKSRRSRSSGLSSSLRSSRSGVIHTFSSSFLIIASIDGSLSTTVHTQQPNRLVPQLGVVVSTTSGHSPPSDAPWYMPRSDLLSWPKGFLTCIRYSHTSSLVQSSMGVKTRELGKLTFG